MGQAKTEPALLVNERAVGTDQNKKFVHGGRRRQQGGLSRGDARAPSVDGLRVVTSGLKAGERIVVNGLQRVRPGALVAPQLVRMDARPSCRRRHANVGQR